MTSFRPSRTKLLAVVLGTVAATTCATTLAAATPTTTSNPLRGVAKIQAQHWAAAAATRKEGEGGDPLELADMAAEYANERVAPGRSVPAAALLAAQQHIAGMPVARASAAQLTRQPMDAEPNGYNDPYWSNAGAGFRDVSGRATALAVDGSRYYAGTADGGVWRSVDSGVTWRPIWDSQATLSIGALYVGRDHSLWVGTGEANTSSDSYHGVGVYRSTNYGLSFTKVGGNELLNHQVFRLADDGFGRIYAATTQGLLRHADNSTSGAWQLVLKPDPNPTGSPYNTSFITDVAIRPGTHGQVVLANLGWRGGTSYNGFYLSNAGGGPGSFTKITPSGDIDAGDIGRTTFAYANDGSKLYAIVQSPAMLNAGEDSNLQGVFVSANGNPSGPYAKIADSDKLDHSGSALLNQPGYHVGIQSWYNQALAVDPSNPNHVYVSLEEVFQTNNGGTTFTTASPYWNYGLPCGTSCPPATHPDQHALALTSDAKVVIGNDGGVFKRSMGIVGYGGWQDLNDTLYTLQYYDGAAGRVNGGLAYWGGLQDNGTTLLLPGAAKNIEPAGGDGGVVLVNPANGMQAVGEYTNLAMYRTSDGGHSFTTISPLCGYYNGANCDPAARFIAPFKADLHDINHWVAAGSRVWDTRLGWSTNCAGSSCDWRAVHSFGKDASGAPNQASAVAVSGATDYAAWVGGGGNPGPAFASGIDTNYGGKWHRISSPVLPNRFIAGLTIDPNNPAHVYAVYNGYSRRWIPGGGQGVLFESRDGGSTWHNISGNLPDAPGDALAVTNSSLVLATDLGVFIASRTNPTTWARVAGIPSTSSNSVRTLPDGQSVLVATHGRGLWRVSLS